jgi:hypothetical protein
MAEILDQMVRWGIAIMLLFVLASVFFFGPGAFFPEVGDKVLTTLGFLGLYKEDTYTSPIHASAELSNKFNDFYNTLENIDNASADCFVRYTPLGDLGDFKIVLRSHTESSTFIELRSNIVDQYKILEGFTPCVVAGKRNNVLVAGNFHKNHLEGLSGNKPEYSDAKHVTLIAEQEMKAELKDDVNTQLEPTGPLKGWIDNFEDYGILYIPEKGKLCFLSTYRTGDDYEIGGLNNDETEELSKKSLKICPVKKVKT